MKVNEGLIFFNIIAQFVCFFGFPGIKPVKSIFVSLWGFLVGV